LTLRIEPIATRPSEPLTFSLFTKPWSMPVAELGPFVRGLGFDGVELPVRPGFQVIPANVARDLPAAVSVLGDAGVSVRSVAGHPTPALIAAVGELGIPTIRTLAPIPEDQNFWQAVDQMRDEWDGLLPDLERHRVTLGVQNHCDRYLTHAMHLWYALRDYDPRQIAAVWDPAHNALQGEDADLALDTIGPRLAMLSLKNATRRLTHSAADGVAHWEIFWTTGRQGLADWSRIAQELHRRGWSGNVCLHAEYTHEHLVDELVREDLVYARAVFAEAGRREARVLTGA
jgi:sugar phosphate isomerase/epimerase